MGDGVENNVLAERIERIGDDVAAIKAEMQRIAAGMERIARLEERHATHNDALTRAFTRVEQIEQRLVKLEVEVPITRMVRGWVISGVIGVVGLLGTQLVAVIFFAAKFVPK